ncbi:hypothetical protein [Fredinandcohnia onubensis]|uniref:hypothetical protein n=1 Tax=Fredinandcohnia onubensis TaxID=1571209 RepID=UPI001C55715B|nr:hypothetical protein [Fredinandcohnia onubensis]
MTAITYLLLIIMFLYTIMFSVSLWKDKNKSGSIVVFGLAIIIAIGPFFTIFK